MRVILRCDDPGGYGWSYQFDPEGVLVEVIELCAARRSCRSSVGAERRPGVIDLSSDLEGAVATRGEVAWRETIRRHLAPLLSLAVSRQT